MCIRDSLNTATTCDADAPVNGWIQVDTGNTMPSGCELLPYFNKIIYLPVYECMVPSVGGAPTFTPGPGTACLTGNGSNTWYYITGYAKFYLSGYKTGGGASATKARTQLVTPQEPCSGSDRCISGWFLRGLVNAPPAPTSTSGSPPLGAYTLQFAG